ncbi:hypothetical protein EDD16DRAFT_1519970 [Pisolithus croceorrhizus]|nr:hypothetical protein EDD16DRAFT_1519970 [Pisolithus croceorrhizus]
MDDSILFRAESELAITEARKQKVERTKLFGSPIQLGGKAIDVVVEGNAIWIVENTHIAKKIDLEVLMANKMLINVKTSNSVPNQDILLTFKPVLNLSESDLLITGSWDQAMTDTCCLPYGKVNLYPGDRRARGLQRASH